MNKVILLDSGPLGLVSNPNISAAATACQAWADDLVARGVQVAVPEITDYEIRRELIRAGKSAGLARLDTLKTTLAYVPLTTAIMLRAAEFWAQARRMGKPTAHDLRLDVDVILAAQAVLIIEDQFEVIVATDNVSHLSRFVPAARWQDIT